MQSEKLTLSKILENPVTKWAIALSLIVLLLSTSYIGLRSQYDLEHKYITVDMCILSLNCSQTQKQVTDSDKTMEIDDGEPEYLSQSGKIKIPVKPLGAGVIAGGISTATVVGLVWLGIVTLPIELALAVGVVIGSGTYFALKSFY